MMKDFKTCFKNGRSPVLAIVAMVIGGLALAVFFAFLFGWIVMLLWNWLMPELFGLPAIQYWQAWGLVLLSHILFKGGPSQGGANNKDGKKSRKEDRESLRSVIREEFAREWAKECAKEEDCSTVGTSAGPEEPDDTSAGPTQP